MDSAWRDFASDNNAGVHPQILAAIQAVNVGHARAYGDDAVTRAANEALRAEFGADVEPWFVFGGTGANVVGLQLLTAPYHAVLCASSAHINEDECGAVEHFTGCKLLLVDARAAGGKLSPPLLEPWLHDVGNEHRAQPRVVSITQPTELGTCYLPEEVAALAAFCREHGLALHMDGARLANAAAYLECSLGQASTACGVDVLSFGGTKQGLLFGEAVIVAQRAPLAGKWVRKQAMQLPSKMRFLSAQFQALLNDELWRRIALHENTMAQALARQLTALGCAPVYPVQANAVFVWLPAARIGELQAAGHFYVWDPAPRADGAVLCRLVTSFDTTLDDVLRWTNHARPLLE